VRPVRFSVARTWGLIVCAASARRELGVDVEHGSRPVRPLDVARRHFAPGEARALAALDEPERARLFFRLWVLKEAYAKGVGVGLAQPLSVPPFADTGAGIVCVDPNLRARWRFALISPTFDHVLGLAASRPFGNEPRVCVHALALGEGHAAIAMKHGVEAPPSQNEYLTLA